MNSAPVQVVPMGASEVDSEPMFSNFPELLTVQDIASITGLAEQTVRRLMRIKVIPSVQIGRRRFCSRRKFIEYVESDENNG